VPRKIAEDEIVDRCILALVAEGARVLDDGIAQRASDIDVVYLTGYGFPRHRGGPMFYADTRGLYDVARRMRAFAARDEGRPRVLDTVAAHRAPGERRRTFNP
jgi:3-hydroxyacyl-CoA dehydrogenase